MSAMTEPTVATLLNSLGIVGPNIRHALRLPTDKMAALDIAYIDNECVCGRIWPCEALALEQAVETLLDERDQLREALVEIVRCDYRGNMPPEQIIARGALAADEAAERAIATAAQAGTATDLGYTAGLEDGRQRGRGRAIAEGRKQERDAILAWAIERNAGSAAASPDLDALIAILDQRGESSEDERDRLILSAAEVDYRERDWTEFAIIDKRDETP